MDKGLGVLILVLFVTFSLLIYLENRVRVKMMEEITIAKYEIKCYQKQLELYKKHVDYRLSFDEKCLYDLVRELEKSKEDD